MKRSAIRAAVAAIAVFLCATSQVMAGTVALTVENDEKTPMVFMVATNCFTDTPHEYWHGYSIAPGSLIRFSANSSSTGSCRFETSTFSYYLGDQTGLTFASYSIQMTDGTLPKNYFYGMWPCEPSMLRGTDKSLSVNVYVYSNAESGVVCSVDTTNL